jgi:hypothetical protein
MNFRTEIQLKKSTTGISYNDSLVLVGSCFTENIGKKFSINKFRTDVNPFGILYNPLSIQSSIQQLIDKKTVTEKDLFFHNGVWQSFAHHGSFSDTSKDACLGKINKRIIESSTNLKQANFFIITFGTAWVYELASTKEIVANCHKLPEKTFNRRCLTIKEIVENYTVLLRKLQAFNPSLQIIFTVSPIRHWKDGAHENQMSKSILLLAIDELQQLFPNTSYFPAYEIVMDELRDYRFYDEDMIHPNNIAINYIWEKFSDIYFSVETEKIRLKIEQIIKAESHRPFNPDTKEHQTFLEKNAQRKSLLQEKYPFLSF